MLGSHAHFNPIRPDALVRVSGDQVLESVRKGVCVRVREMCGKCVKRHVQGVESVWWCVCVCVCVHVLLSCDSRVVIFIKFCF